MLASASMGPAFSLAGTLGPMVAAAGSMTVWALLATAAIMLLLALTFSQLTTNYPDAGSSYAWARRAFGETAGAYTAWILLVANFFAVLATAIPAGVYALELVAPRFAEVPAWDAAIGIVWIVGCALVLFAGMRPAARVATVVLVAELGVLAASAVAGFGHAAPPPVAGAAVSAGFGGFVAAMALGIWFVDGWEISATVAEEASGDARSAGTGGVLGLVLTVVFLLGCTIAYLHLGGVAGLAGHEVDVLAFVGERLGGVWRPLLIATVLISLTGALETTLLYLVRSVYAMSRDGVLPHPLARLGNRTGDPDRALGAVTVLVVAATAAVGLVPRANAALEIVLDGTAVFLGLLFLTSCAAWVRLRRQETPLFAIVAGIALIPILGVATLQAELPTRWCIAAGLVLGVPVAIAAARRKAAVQVAAPEALNIGG